MDIPLRVVLPLAMAIISVPLVAWDGHNARVIESMGMAWDMGPPIWPYQVSDLLLRFLNAPAYSIAMPVANLLRLAAPMHFILVGPATLLWWWFVGLTADRGIHWWNLLVMLGILLSLLLWTTTGTHGFFRMRFEAAGSDIVTLLRVVTPTAWLMAVTCLLHYRR